jgi:hypothetical protein
MDSDKLEESFEDMDNWWENVGAPYFHERMYSYPSYHPPPEDFSTPPSPRASASAPLSAPSPQAEPVTPPPWQESLDIVTHTSRSGRNFLNNIQTAFPHPNQPSVVIEDTVQGWRHILQVSYCCTYPMSKRQYCLVDVSPRSKHDRE